MGWFSRKEKAHEPASTVDEATGLDFAKYGLDQLGEDIRSIVNIPGAIGQAAKYAVTLPFVVAIVYWAVFSSRMSSVALVPFSIVAFLLSLVGSMVVGGFFVARKRLDTVADASDRVLGVINEMHSDVIRVKEGHSGTTVQEVAIGLLENAIFPAVFGTMNTAAETALGPIGRFASGVTKAPMKLVEKSVISGIQALPDKELGKIVTDIGESLPAVTAEVDRLQTEYGQVRSKMESIVDTVSRTALGSVLGVAAATSLPLAVWFLLSWVLT